MNAPSAGPADAPGGSMHVRAILAALEHSPGFVCLLRGPQHVFAYANANYSRLVDGRPLLGLPVRVALPEIAGQGYFEILDRVYRTGEGVVGKEVPAELAGPAGVEARYVDFAYTPLRDARGEVDGILVHGVDVTDQVRTRKLLEQQDRQFDALLSAVADFVYLFDREGRFRYVNRALLDLWGLPLAAAVGKNFHDLAYPAELADRLQRQIAEVVATGRKVVDETPYTSPVTGVVAHYEYIFTPIFADDGVAVEAVAGTTREISARKRAEAGLARASAEAQKMVRLKDEFLATLSHELRTPMSAIMGWAQVLERRCADDPFTCRATEAITRNARAQARLIEDIVDLSRIEAGKVRLSLQPVDVAQAARAAAESLAPLAEAKPVAIDIASPSPAVFVRADADRLQQVFWNLLSNAVKFTTPDGRVAVRIRRDGTNVIVEVADDGIGIRPDFLPYVFDRFRQGDGTTTRRAGGLGIGLAVARQLVELQGGTIAAASGGEGQGATFTVTLPTEEAAAVRAAAPAVRADLTAMPLAGLTVLVVDDEEDIRVLLQHLLHDAGAAVLAADGTMAALDLASRHRPDAVLCDLQMPRHDGFDFLRRFREAHGDGTPAIAFSAMAQVEDQQRALAAGYRTFLAKPLPAEEIVAAVRRVTGR